MASAETTPYSGYLVSADSHVIEPQDLWAERLPQRWRDQAPRFPGAAVYQGRPGGTDPKLRLEDLKADGVSAEVLYPTLGNTLYSAVEGELQEECFRVYNDWLLEYCAIAPKRLLGVAMIPCYSAENAVKEMTRVRKKGMGSIMIWQAPPKHLPLYSAHYEPIWAAAEDMQMPISLHIVSGFDWGVRLAEQALTGHAISEDEKNQQGWYGFRGEVSDKLRVVMDVVNDIMYAGIVKKHPKLKFVIVENEIGWIPFFLSQMDKYFARRKLDMPLPSEQFRENFFATFFNDQVGTDYLDRWGPGNCMWSNDFPHHNSTWPHSRKIIAEHLAHVSGAERENLTWKTACDLYQIESPATLEAAA
jgi:predicted TIM-barrel fold metal-dependent hydrolase